MQLKNGLVNYWPIIGAQSPSNKYVKHLALATDLVGKSNIHFDNFFYDKDRHKQINSALRGNGTNLIMPAGVYFAGGDFTVSLWIKCSREDTNARILDVYNIKNDSSNTHADAVSIWHSDKHIPTLQIQSKDNKSHITQATKEFTIDAWELLTITLSGTHAKIYLNSTLVGEDLYQFVPVNAYRQYAYLAINSTSSYDDIRIYNRALNSTEIVHMLNL